MTAAFESEFNEEWREQQEGFGKIVKKIRQHLNRELDEGVLKIKRRIPKDILNLTLRDFLQLESIVFNNVGGQVARSSILPLSEASSGGGRKKSEIKVDTSHSVERRVTRSMSRQSIIQSNSQSVNRSSTSIPPTPKFHPGLPETPQTLRRKARSTTTKSNSRSNESNIFEKSGPRRSMRSSVIARTSIRKSSIKGRKESINGIISMELEGGQVVDVDITQSPSKVMANLGADAVKEMRNKMQAYALQLKSFFNRLKTS